MSARRSRIISTQSVGGGKMFNKIIWQCALLGVVVCTLWACLGLVTIMNYEFLSKNPWYTHKRPESEKEVLENQVKVDILTRAYVMYYCDITSQGSEYSLADLMAQCF